MISLPIPTKPETVDDIRTLFATVYTAVCGCPVIDSFFNGAIPRNGTYATLYADVIDSPAWDTLTVSADDLSETVRGQCAVKLTFVQYGNDAIQTLRQFRSFLTSIEAESFYVWPVVGRGEISSATDISALFRGEFRRAATLSVVAHAALPFTFSDNSPLRFTQVETTVIKS